MTTRRCARPLAAATLAMVAAVGGGLATAGPALAAPPVITFTSPTNGSRVTTSATKVDAKVTMPDGRLKSISLAVTPLTGGGAPVSAGPVAGADAPSRDVSFGITLPFNGRYKAEITATGNDSLLGIGQDTTRRAAIEFSMVAPPAAPRNVRTSADAATREVTVSWARNSEPDLLFYLVQRSLGGGEYVLAAKTTELSIVDTATTQAGGEYSYQVVAVRAGASSDEGVNSNPSSVSTASVAAPPAPPTTAPPETTPQEPTTTVPGGSGTTVPSAAGPGSATPASPPPSTGTTIPAGNPGALTRSGTVDLSGLRALQAQPAPRRGSPPTTVDTGFDQNLPFDPDAAPADTALEPEGSTEFDDSIFEETEVGADTELGAEDDTEKTRALAFLAAGLLATVLLMHVLWVRGEVARVPLEALPPADPKAEKKQKPKARSDRVAGRAGPVAGGPARPRPGRPGPGGPGGNGRPRPRPGPDPRLARPRPDREDLPIG